MLANIPGVHAQYYEEVDERRRKALIEQIHNYHEIRKKSEYGREPVVTMNGRYLGNNPQLKAQLEIEKRHGKEIAANYGYALDVEPTFAEIKFYEPESAKTLGQRIDKLLHGITQILPNEYDLYGYELRRYMSSIAGPEVLGDRKRLSKEIANTKRAAIILEYWSKGIREEIKAIETLLENDKTIDPTTRTTFKFKSGKAKAFLIEADSWVSNNNKMLQFLFDLHSQYSYKEPVINFTEHSHAQGFLSLFRARQKSLELIHEYAPFRMMIY